MKISFLPKTKCGRLSVILLIFAFAALLLVGMKALMGVPFPDITVLLHILIVGTIVLFSVSLAAGIMAIVKSEERSILVFGILLIDIFFVIIVTLIFIGVLVSP